MDIRLFLIYVVMFSAMHQGPAAYRDLMCMEPEPGYTKMIFHHFQYFTAFDIGKECPTSADLAWRIVNEVFCTLLCVLLTLMLGYVPSIARSAKARWSTMVTMDRGWRNRPSRCRHCGTAPCQVKRSSSRSSSKCQKRDKANFAKRSNAMMLFSNALALSVEQTKELSQDELYWERKSCQSFKEKHMMLFPQCIQRQINYWYPVPRIARLIAPTAEKNTDNGRLRNGSDGSDVIGFVGKWHIYRSHLRSVVLSLNLIPILIIGR